MKRNLFYSMIVGMIICLFIACNNDDFIDDGMDINGYEPSFNDTLAVPTESVYLGDSIQLMKSFDLNQYPVGKLTVSTTENGYITVLGGYKQYSAVYVYAKLEEELPKLTNEEIKALLNKYYLIESHLDGKEIVVTIKKIQILLMEMIFIN